MTSVDGLIGIVTAVVIGSAVAVAVALAASPLAPIGPVRAIDPSRGLSADWAVLGIGFLALVACSTTIALLIGYRRTPHRLANRLEGASERGSVVARVADRSRLPVPAVTGVHYALESGRGGNTVPVRSAIVGAALAIVVVTGTLTFGASLHGLVSHPERYGW